MTETNAKSAAATEVVVRQDTNANGVADPGETQTLSQLGIVSIGLAATQVDEAVSGNGIKLTQRESSRRLQESVFVSQRELPVPDHRWNSSFIRADRSEKSNTLSSQGGRYLSPTETGTTVIMVVQ